MNASDRLNTPFSRAAPSRWTLRIVLTSVGIGGLITDDGRATGAPTPAPDATAAEPMRHAILIGIGDYKYQSDLQGPGNDVDAMYALLTKTFRFPANSVETIKDRQATRAGILDAFDRLYRKVQKNKSNRDAVAVIYFSGHGSQRRDEANGDEIDDYDETLVTYDSAHSRKPNRDITDDELNVFIKALNAHGMENITVIFDSCHSGSATRGYGIRKVERDTRPPPKTRPRSWMKVARGADGSHLRSDSATYALLSGSRADQFSHEKTYEGRTYGALTYHLTRELNWTSTHNEAVTYRDVMEKVKAKVNGEFPFQVPLLEGAKMDNFVFGTRSARAEPYVEVSLSQPGEIELSVGAVHGVTVGSEWEVYAPGTRKFPTGRGIQAKITQVRASTSRAKLLRRAAIRAASRAIERSHIYPPQAVRVHVVPSSPNRVALAVKARLEKDKASAFDFVPKGASYDLALREHKGTVQVELGPTGPGDTALGVSPPVSVRDSDAVDRVIEQLKHWAKWLNLRRLESSGTPFNVDYRLEIPESTLGAHILEEGTEFSLAVTNRSGKGLYVALLSLSSDGSVEVVYPEPGIQPEYLSATGTWKKALATYIPEGQEAIRDYLKLILTTSPTSYDSLRMGAVRSAQSQKNPLAQLLEDGAFATRSVRAVPPNIWTTEIRGIEVRRRSGQP